MFRYRDRIARLSFTRERRDAFENELVIGPEEIFSDDDVADAVPGRAIEHEAAQHRLLRLDGMRRRAQIACARIFTTEFRRARHCENFPAVAVKRKGAAEVYPAAP